MIKKAVKKVIAIEITVRIKTSEELLFALETASDIYI